MPAELPLIHDAPDERPGLPEDFVAIVLELKHWLGALRTRVDSRQAGPDGTKSPRDEDGEDARVLDVSSALSQRFPQDFGRLEATLGDSSPTTRESAYAFFRTQMKDLYYAAPFAARSLSKPLGYPGDYLTIDMIYADDPIGETTFARCVQRYLLDEPAARAVRNRGRYLARILERRTERGPFTALSVGSGPAAELRELIGTGHANLRRSEFHLIDQDRAALQHSEREIRRLGARTPNAPTVTYTRKNLKQVIARGLGTARYDLIYAAGLFDYLPDPVATAAARALIRHLAAQGRLIIGNFAKANPSRFGMEMALDWHLVHRSREDLRRLFHGIGTALQIDEEELGVNLFCHISPRGAPSRDQERGVA